MSDTQKPDTARAMRAILKIKDARATARHAWEAEDNKLKEKEEALLGWLMAEQQRMGVTGIKVDGVGTSYTDTKVSVTIADFGSFSEWVGEHNAYDFFERRVKSTAVKEYMEEHNGETPPGLNLFKELQIKIRRAKE